MKGTAGGLYMPRNLIKLSKQSEDAKTQARQRSTIRVDNRCVFKQISPKFSRFLSVLVKGKTFLSGFCHTWQFHGLLLQLTNPWSHNKHKHKIPGVCFCPISSKVVSLEQILRGSVVSICLLPPYFSSLSPFALSTSHQRSESWCCLRLKELQAQRHIRCHPSLFFLFIIRQQHG